jgi:TRAP-type mannitol/chloroaromatic compound transport system permease large subunit
MIGALLFVSFVVLMLAGVPIGVSLGLGGVLAIGLANMDSAHFGLLAVPQNFYASLTKYPLLALPMFVLVGSIFDRSFLPPAIQRATSRST